MGEVSRQKKKVIVQSPDPYTPLGLPTAYSVQPVSCVLGPRGTLRRPGSGSALRGVRSRANVGEHIAASSKHLLVELMRSGADLTLSKFPDSLAS